MCEFEADFIYTPTVNLFNTIGKSVLNSFCSSSSTREEEIRLDSSLFNHSAACGKREARLITCMGRGCLDAWSSAEGPSTHVYWP